MIASAYRLGRGSAVHIKRASGVTHVRALSSPSASAGSLDVADPGSAEKGNASVKEGPGLEYFIAKGSEGAVASNAQATPPVYFDATANANKSAYIETYGCQMNVSDTEIVRSVLKSAGYSWAESPETADCILVNTCAIRDNAERKVWDRLRYFGHVRKERRKARGQDTVVGLLGCMAERLKSKLLEEDRLVDVVAGPDAYRDLPHLLTQAADGNTAINVMLSADESYADIAPVRTGAGKHSAFVSIMRGCNNMCAYCIVPFTRGRERSRPVASILNEVRRLSDEGYKEITVLGQNVNSFCDKTSESRWGEDAEALADGFRTIYKRTAGGVRFAELMDEISRVNPEMRVRFTSPHPKDFPDALLHLIAERPNLCNYIHMPAQSGSTRMLELMRRGYSRESYLQLVDRIREIIPGIGLSSDFISGFCGETEADHLETLSLMEHVKYDQAFMFAYSMREKTHAHRKMSDDVPEDVKQRRLREVIDVFQRNATEVNKEEHGRVHCVLVEGTSRRSDEQFAGRADNNKRVIFDRLQIPSSLCDGERALVDVQPGDYVAVRVTGSTSASLQGTPIARTTLAEFAAVTNWDAK